MRVEKLSRLSLFRNVPQESLERLLKVCLFTRYFITDQVFVQGSAANQALLLVEGRLEVSVKGSGTHHHVGIIYPGEVVGEQALFVSGGRCNASVFANQASVCLILSPELFQSNNNDPAIAALERHLIATLTRRIRKTNLEIQKAWKASRVAVESAPQRSAPQRSAPPTFRERLKLLFGGRF